LGTDNLAELRKLLDTDLHKAIARNELQHEERWTQSLAIGSRDFINDIQPLILSRRETEIRQEDSGLWVLRETETPYGS
jgi:hypothetical protein